MEENTCDLAVASYKSQLGGGSTVVGLRQWWLKWRQMCCKTVVCLISRSNPPQ